MSITPVGMHNFIPFSVVNTNHLGSSNDTIYINPGAVKTIEEKKDSRKDDFSTLTVSYTDGDVQRYTVSDEDRNHKQIMKALTGITDTNPKENAGIFRVTA